MFGEQEFVSTCSCIEHVQFSNNWCISNKIFVQIKSYLLVKEEIKKSTEKINRNSESTENCMGTKIIT